MRKADWFLLFLILVVGFLIVWQPQLGWDIERFIFERPSAVSEADHAVEIARLRAELAALEGVKGELPAAPRETLQAIVYSRYPFALRNRIIVNAGKNHGVRARLPVTWGGFLIGSVELVYEETSVVQTIFDRRWQQAVRVGRAGVDALLSGGDRPVLTFIDKDAALEDRAAVINAAPQFPYGVPVGELTRVRLSPNGLYQEADLGVPYKIHGIKAISILMYNAPVSQP